MHRRQRTLAEMLTRSLATAGLLYALILAYAVPASLLNGDPHRPGPTGPGASSTAAPPAWRPIHGNRFPGCVDMARWQASDVPATVVVVRRNGDLARMPFDEAYRRATSASAADDVFTIGACG